MNNIVEVLGSPHICFLPSDREKPEAYMLGVKSHSIVLVNCKQNTTSNYISSLFPTSSSKNPLKDVSFNVDIVAECIAKHWNEENLADQFSPQLLANMQKIAARCPSLGKCLFSLERLNQQIELLQKIGVEEADAKEIINKLPELPEVVDVAVKNNLQTEISQLVPFLQDKHSSKLNQQLVKVLKKLCSKKFNQYRTKKNIFDLLGHYLEVIKTDKTYQNQSLISLYQITNLLTDPVKIEVALSFLVNLHAGIKTDMKSDLQYIFLPRGGLNKILKHAKNYDIVRIINYFSFLINKEDHPDSLKLIGLLTNDMKNVATLILVQLAKQTPGQLTGFLSITQHLFYHLDWSIYRHAPIDFFYETFNNFQRLELRVLEHNNFVPLILTALKDFHYCSEDKVQKFIVKWINFLSLLTEEEQITTIESNNPLLLKYSSSLIKLFESYSLSAKRSCLLTWVLSNDAGNKRLQFIYIHYQTLMTLDIISSNLLAGLDKLLSSAHKQQDKHLTKIVELYRKTLRSNIPEDTIDKTIDALSCYLEVCDILRILSSSSTAESIDWQTLTQEIKPLLQAKKGRNNLNILLMFMNKSSAERKLWIDVFKGWFQNYLQAKPFNFTDDYLLEAISDLSFEKFEKLSPILDDFMAKPINKAWQDRFDVLWILSYISDMYDLYFVKCQETDSADFETWSCALRTIFDKVKMKDQHSQFGFKSFPRSELLRWISTNLRMISHIDQDHKHIPLDHVRVSISFLKELSEEKIDEFENLKARWPDSSYGLALEKSARK